MFCYLALLLVFFLIGISAHAQDEADRYPQRFRYRYVEPGAFQDSTITAGFDPSLYHPFFIKSRDGQYSLHISAYAQLRYNATFLSNTPEEVQSVETGYLLGRFRMFLEGNLTDKFYYHIRTNVNPAGNFELIAAYIQYNIDNKNWLRFGRQFMALSLEDWMYPLDLAAIEFSAMDFEFALWSSFGLQWRHIASDKFRSYVSIGNGSYGGRRTFPAPADSDLALIGRGEWNIMGGTWGRWDDMVGRKDKFPLGMMLGFSIGNQFRFDKEVIQTQPNGGTQVNLDYSLQGQDMHFFAAFNRTWTRYESGVGQDFYRDGFYTTLGYWIDNQWFSYARFDFVGKGNTPDPTNTLKNYAAPGAGVSYYPFFFNNKIRFTLEYNYLANPIDATTVSPDGQLGFVPSPYGAQSSLRFQAQFGF
ncbi:porin family protein [Pararhodonellum marinum]|uniref:porin n=1 Tax=Pararhodonellum marinum TaxID=2755358 RepID=UPI00188F6EBB|nr:porin [Pararhodonellum marinum]